MGNYGNTMDRWYRRAAVVVWPRPHGLAARAEASASWGLTELRARVDAGDLVNARAAAESVAPFWKAPGPELLGPAGSRAGRSRHRAHAAAAVRGRVGDARPRTHAG